MTLEEAIKRTNDNILNERRLLTLVTSSLARRAFKIIKYQPQKMEEFGSLFTDGSVKKLRQWFKKTIDPELGELNVRDLRKLASRYMVPYYYQLTKLELIQEISDAKKTNVTSDI